MNEIINSQNKIVIKKISENPELKLVASRWFHEKWGIDYEEYFKSMTESIESENAVPEWYVITKDDSIIAGLGVIENDFHNRFDLTPNICAVYVEPPYRKRGLARALLDFACKDMESKGINTLYLLTGHVGFYERCGWDFFCMVLADGEDKMSRMYVHTQHETK